MFMRPDKPHYPRQTAIWLHVPTCLALPNRAGAPAGTRAVARPLRPLAAAAAAGARHAMPPAASALHRALRQSACLYASVSCTSRDMLQVTQTLQSAWQVTQKGSGHHQHMPCYSCINKPCAFYTVMHGPSKKHHSGEDNLAVSGHHINQTKQLHCASLCDSCNSLCRCHQLPPQLCTPQTSAARPLL